MLTDPTLRVRILAVETVASLDADGGYLSLALDDQDRAHGAYWTNSQSSHGRLHYAVRTSQGWGQEEVVVMQGAQTALALDGEGRPLLAYLDLAKAELKLARQAAGGWRSETVAAGLNSFAPGALTLTFDRAGRPVITYFDEEQLKLARFTTAGWQLVTVDDALGSGYYHDAAPAGDGDLLIASANMISQSVRLWRVRPDNEALLEEEVTIAPGTFDYLSLALDHGGRPHLCYAAPGGLIHAFKGNEGWQEESIKEGAGLGLYAGLRAGGGRLKAAHYDADEGRLLIARRENGAWLEEHADGGNGRDVGGHAALIVDAQGTAHVAYTNWDDRAVKYVRDNTPPIAEDDRFETLVNMAVSGNVLLNDGDLEEDPIRVTAKPVAGPSNGKVTLDAAGEMAYTPDEGFHGEDIFRYEVRDERGLSSTAEVTVDVQVPVRIHTEPELEWWANEADGCRIALRLADAGSSTWAGVLREDPPGVWETVKADDGADAWHGTRDGDEWNWWVPKRYLGLGPFRWVVYSKKGGYHLVYSEPFDMPTLTGRTLVSTGTIS